MSTQLTFARMNCNSLLENEEWLPGPLLREIHIINTITKRVGIKMLAEQALDVSMEQVPILVCLLHHGPLSQQQIAELIDRDKGSIARSVVSLQQHGMLTVGQDPNNKRMKRITISELGRAQMEKVADTTQELTKHINSCMLEEGMPTYIETLVTLKNCLASYHEKLTTQQA